MVCGEEGGCIYHDISEELSFHWVDEFHDEEMSIFLFIFLGHLTRKISFQFYKPSCH